VRFSDMPRAAPVLTGSGPQIDRLGGAITNDHYSNPTATATPEYRSRAWWQANACCFCSDWPAVVHLALDIIGANMESDFERACRIAAEQHPIAAPPKPRPRPTPQTTIEALLWSIRERGPAALHEPANIERLRRCDKAAVAEIDARMTKLKGACK
jgi:hypothetical protein